MKLIKPVSPAGVGKRTDHPIKTSKHDSNSMDANINNFLDYNKKKKTIWMIFNHDVTLFFFNNFNNFSIAVYPCVRDILWLFL